MAGANANRIAETVKIDLEHSISAEPNSSLCLSIGSKCKRREIFRGVKTRKDCHQMSSPQSSSYTLIHAFNIAVCTWLTRFRFVGVVSKNCERRSLLNSIEVSLSVYLFKISSQRISSCQFITCSLTALRTCSSGLN